MANNHFNFKGRHHKHKVERLIVLPFHKSFDIAVKNLKVRFSRSLITVASLVLAVAFLGFVFVNNDIVNGVLDEGGPRGRTLLKEAGFDLPNNATDIGSGAKERWIVFLSLLVCTVGIINAQLMSVTERFREIGVMKCLGALDKIVLRLFLMEAVMQGLAGSAAGAVLGGVFALFMGLIHYGLLCFTCLSFTDLGLSLLSAVGIGCLLSVVGVFYPAIVAARMRPVEAMRAEH